MRHSKEDQHRHGHHGGCGHEQMIARVGRLQRDVLEEAHADRCCVKFGRIEVDEGTEKIVPIVEKGEDRDRGQRRFHQRDDDLPQNLERIGAINRRRFVQIARDAENKLA